MKKQKAAAPNHIPVLSTQCDRFLSESQEAIHLAAPSLLPTSLPKSRCQLILLPLLSSLPTQMTAADSVAASAELGQPPTTVIAAIDANG